MVERISRQPFEQFLRERVLGPLGMHDSHLRRNDPELWPNTATQHVRHADGRYEREQFGPPMDGAGGLVSTVDDMLRWVSNMSDPRVGSPDTWRQMTTPARLNTGGGTAYALGLMLGPRHGHRAVHHSGNVMVGTAEPVPQPAQLEAQGDYLDVARGRVVRLLPQADHTDAEINGVRVPILRRNDGSLWCRSNPVRGATLSIAQRDSSLAWTEFDQTSILPRMELPGVGAVATLDGDYAVEGLELKARIETADGEAGHTMLALRGPHGRIDYRLQAIGHRAWLARHSHPLLPSGALLLQAADGCLAFSTQRTRGLVLKRT
jgi:D-aminopeptidase